MTIYLILMTLLLIITINYNNISNKNRTYIFCFFVAVIFCMASFRDFNVGCDSLQYATMFYRESYERRDYEVGFSKLIDTLRLISDSHISLFVVSSIIIIIPLMIYVKKNSINPIFSIYLYITLNYFAMHMNVMRQAIALGLIIIGLYLHERNKSMIRYMIFNSIACVFHYSAVVAFFLPLLYRRKLSIKNYLIILLFVILFIPFAYEVFAFVASNLSYIHYDEYVSSGAINFSKSNYCGAVLKAMLSACFFVLCYCLFLNNKVANDENINFYTNCLFITLLIHIISTQAVVLERFVIYFDWVTIVSLPVFIFKNNNRKQKITYFIFITIITSAHWFVIALFRPEWHKAVPYISIFNR